MMIKNRYRTDMSNIFQGFMIGLSQAMPYLSHAQFELVFQEKIPGMSIFIRSLVVSSTITLFNLYRNL